jgi:outer membrane protein OmpA-like peptidoglycan-associated protein
LEHGAVSAANAMPFSFSIDFQQIITATAPQLSFFDTPGVRIFGHLVALTDMRLLSSCHSLLLCPLLLMTLLAHTQQQRQDTLLLHFAVDKYDIRPEDTAEAARFLRDSLTSDKKVDSVVIIGYTDKTGTVTHNQWLSGERAIFAGNWLQTQLSNIHPYLIPGGIAPTPQRTDSDNRRAEIVIHYHLNAPRPADTAVALHRDSTQPTAIISLPINFVVDTPIPTDATQLTLPGYVNQLQQYKDRRMEIDGFCNSLAPLSGPDDPLFKLSVNRAKFIYDYLIQAGFDPVKLTYKGMGNASPVNPDPVTRQQMDANMRVEIKVY